MDTKADGVQPVVAGCVEELNRMVAANPQNTDKAKHLP